MLVLIDVRSLHTSIPNDEGINAVKEAMDKEAYKTVKTSVIRIFLYCCLDVPVYNNN